MGLWSTDPDLDAVSHSGHCLLFEALRFFAYSIVNREREQGTYQSFKRLLKAYAHSLNNYQQRGFEVNLNSAQVRARLNLSHAGSGIDTAVAGDAIAA